MEPLDAAVVALARTLADCDDDEVCKLGPQRHQVATLAGRLEPLLLALRGQPFRRNPDEVRKRPWVETR